MKTFFLLALLLGSTVEESAWASPATIGPISTVRYRDLDLNPPGGRAVLAARLKRAVRNVCDDPGFKTIEDRQRIAGCIELASENAERQVP